MIDNVKKFADSVEDQKTQENPWSGEFTARSLFQAYQDSMAQNYVKDFANKSITFDFSISDNAEVLRGYNTDDGLLSDEESLPLDQLFNAWLADNDMLTKDGVIYQSTADGEIKQDEKGQNKRANAEKLRELIKDEKKGFSQYVSKKSSSTKMTPVEHPYGGKSAEKTEAEKIEAKKPKKEAVQEKPEEKPEGPS
jgi:hypothetical protein